MRKFFLGCLGVAATAFALQFTQVEVNAGLFDQCKPCDEAGECNPCDEAACDPCAEVACGAKGKFFVNGYAEAGFFANEYGFKNQYGNTRHGRQWAGNSSVLQNVGNTGGQLNQLYISAGKSVSGKNGWDFGGTVDFTFGTDASSVQSNGLEKTERDAAWGTGDYYSAFAQAYFEAEYKKWNFKVGKFYAPFGSNGYKSTDRFFYSLADTYAFVPATVGGAYATYAVNDKLAVYGGWVTPDEIGYHSDDNFFLGGAIWQPTKKLNLHYAFATGNFGHYGGEPSDIDAFVNSLVATYQINKKLKTIFDWSLINANIASGANLAVYGINSETIYQYNSKWALGVRAGWTYSNNNNLVAWSAADDKYTFSVGANWTPTSWLLVKPELRYDKFDEQKRFDGNTEEDQFSGGLSAIVKF